MLSYTSYGGTAYTTFIDTSGNFTYQSSPSPVGRCVAGNAIKLNGSIYTCGRYSLNTTDPEFAPYDHRQFIAKGNTNGFINCHYKYDGGIIVQNVTPIVINQQSSFASSTLPLTATNLQYYERFLPPSAIDSVFCNGTVSSDTAVPFHQTVTGLQEPTNPVAEFRLYPNPASDKLFIQTNGIEIEQVNIYNTTGSLVMAVQQSTINIESLTNGIYIAEIKTKEGSVRRRWVKM